MIKKSKKLKKIYIILKGGLVQDVLVDRKLAGKVEVEVLNYDEDTDDAHQRTQALYRMLHDDDMHGVNYFSPKELYYA